MNFKSLLENYEEVIELAKIQKRRKDAPKGVEYWNAFIDGAFHLFQNMKYEIGFEPEVEYPTEEEKQKYYLQKYKEYPFAILNYRGQEVPIYIDDYGQQEYMVFQGKEYSGGAYNFECRKDFCCIIDDYLDRKTSE